ncbi:MAG: tetratricopeptide repeat protein [Pseudonocardiaceae bacterium]
MTSRSQRVTAAIQLRETGQYKSACSAFLVLAKDFPDDQRIAYQTAWAHDKLGEEANAVEFYVRALRGDGLTPDERQGALLGLGSTYRALGHHEESVRTLRRGVEEFPEDHAVRTFLALALHDSGQHRAAFNIVLRLLVESSPNEMIKEYRRPLLEYAQEPDGG